jgi:tetratricopeptide (TPR) repeat protein
VRDRSARLAPLLALLALAGCATPYTQGRAALRQERYDEALSHFTEALARDASRLDARAGLGVARYKLGALDEAAAALRQVVAAAPKHAEARFYLALAYVQKGQNSAAEEQLTALLALEPHPRIAAQIDRALKVIRTGPLSDEVKRFVTASLEDEAEWEQEVREAERAQRVYVVEPPGLIYWPYWYPRRYPLP